MNDTPRPLTDFLPANGDALHAFAQAFAAGIRHLWIPRGRYVLQGTLRLPSGTRLSAAPDACLVLADGVATSPGDYMLTNSGHACGDHDISIEGGTWDANNRHNSRPPGLFDMGYSGAMFHFENVTGLTLKNLTLTNAEAYYTRFTHVQDFHIEDIRLDSDNIRHNNDGIHLGGHCRRGVIRNIRGLRPGVTGDDLVALNADDALQRCEVRGMTNGPIEDIDIDGLEAEDCLSFVRLLSVWSPIRNVRIRNVLGTCNLSAINADAARGCRVPLFDEKNPPFPDGVGLLENIEISNFQVAKSRGNGVPLLRLETRNKNFRVRNFIRVTEKDLDASAATIGIKHILPQALDLDSSKKETSALNPS